MEEHANVELLRRGFEAFASRDVAALTEVFAADVVWHQPPGSSPLAGDKRGLSEVLQMFGQSAEISGGTFRVDVHDILANDEHAVVLARLTAQRDGRQLDLNAAFVYHVANGALREVWHLSEDPETLHRFWR